MQYMYYLCACNRGLFKNYYRYVLFRHSKNLIFYEIYFWFLLYIFFKKFRLNKYKKQICHKENKSFFLIYEKWPNCSFRSLLFLIYPQIFFLAEKWRTIERARRYVCKNLLNLDSQDSIRFGICQVAYKWRIIWEEFLPPIICKIL